MNRNLLKKFIQEKVMSQTLIFAFSPKIISHDLVAISNAAIIFLIIQLY